MLKGDWGQKRISKTGGIDKIVRGVRLCYFERANVRRGARMPAEKVNFILSEKTDEIFFVIFSALILYQSGIFSFFTFSARIFCVPVFVYTCIPGLFVIQCEKQLTQVIRR